MSADSGSLSFPLWLKRRRGALGWTQAVLAHQISCALVTVKRIEAGSLLPSAQLAALLAQKLAVPPEQQAAFITFSRDPEATVAEMSFWPILTPVALPHLLSLPALLTATIGREREVQAACQLLRRPDVRLVTLTGPPGTGKTRLSIEIAQAMSGDFADGLCFVPLAPVRDEAAVFAAMAQALALPEGRGQSAEETVRHYLAGKQFLLILDNFEQVVAAAPHLTTLLTHAPGLKILVSSREWLNCYGEHEFPVPPLAIPDVQHLPPVEALSGYSAITLFVARAQAVNPAFILDNTTGPAIAQICAWLDGLPLAIEMAAARVRRFSVDQLLQQLTHRLQTLIDGPRNLSPRQQTLRGAIDWSYDLLPEDERRLFAYCSLFVTGTAEAIAAVASDNLDPAQVLSGLYALTDKSLLRLVIDNQGNTRFYMLETLREYGLERLQEWGLLLTAQNQFAHYYLQQAEMLAQRLHEEPEQQLSMLGEIDRELANFQAALRWATNAAADETICLRFCVALYIYWETRGHYSEGSRLMVEALNRATAPSSERARVLASASLLFRWIGHSDKALALLEEAIALCEQLGDEMSLASGVHHLGQHYGMELDYAAAAAQFGRSLEIYRRLGKPSAVARVLGSLGQAQLRQGAYDEAEKSYGEALEIRQQLREEHGISHSLHGLGQCALLRGDLPQAEKMFQEALRLRYRWGHRRHLSNTFDLLGKLRVAQGNIPEGVRLMGLARGMWREMGLREIGTDEHMAAARTVLGDELMAQYLAEGETLSVEQALKIVEAL
jgi:predicted ATPase/transcriptional regulator with XRE-family HTH domain